MRNGYPVIQLKGKTWHLPHHGVNHASKTKSELSLIVVQIMVEPL